MGHMTELLLYAAARAQLVEEVIQPALDQGKVVICDRFIESSAVYQGIARGLGVDLVYEVNRFAVGNTMPDITLLLDVDAETGIGRKKQQAEAGPYGIRKAGISQESGGRIQAVSRKRIKTEWLK